MITIDNEFASLIPPLSQEEFEQLEQNCLREGIRDSLVIWQHDGKDILIDGHNRYRISQMHNLPYVTDVMTFQDRDEVIHWIILNQFGRRNLSAYDRSVLALKLKPVIAKQAKEQQIRKPSDFVCPNLDKQKPIDTKKEIAEIAGVSHGTLHKVETIVNRGSDELNEKVKSGETSIHAAYQEIREEEKKKISEEAKPHVVNNSGDNEWYTPAQFIESARKVMGSIDLDPASCEFANKTVQATTFYTKEDDGTECEWYGNVWLNPPYGSGQIENFAVCVSEGGFDQAIILVNNATETQWFAAMVEGASAIVFKTGRIKYLKPDGQHGSPLQGQAFIYHGDFPDRFLEEFEQYGWGAKL